MVYKLLILIGVMSFAGCKSNNFVDAQLSLANKLMRSRPDSALQIVESINRDDISRRSTRAYYSLLYSQALDKNVIDLTSDTLIRSAVEYYEYHGRKIDKAKSWYYLARIYENMGDLDNAIKSYVEAERYMVDTRAKRLLAMLYGNVGNLYAMQNSFDEALEMYDKSIATYHGLNTVNEAYALSGKAGILHLQSKYEQGLEVLDQAENVAISYADTACLLELAQNRAALLTDMGETPDRILGQITEYYRKYNDGHFSTEIFPLLSTCYYKMKKLDSAKYYVDAALDRIEDYAPVQAKGLYVLAARIYETAGDFEAANEFLYDRSELLDSLHKQDKANLIQDLEQKYHTEQVKQSYVRLRHRHIGIVIFSILIIIILGCVSWIVYRKKQNQITEYYNFADTLKSSYAVLQRKHDDLKEELGQHDDKSRLLYTALDNRMKSLQKVMELAGSFEGRPEVFYQKMRKHLKIENNKSDHALADLYDITNLYYGGIIDYLREHHADLNDEDLALSCMICLGFTPQQTRVLFNHTNSSSIYTKRSKLRKKLGLSDTDNLEEFFDSVISQLCKKL